MIVRCILVDLTTPASIPSFHPMVQCSQPDLIRSRLDSEPCRQRVQSMSYTCSMHYGTHYICAILQPPRMQPTLHQPTCQDTATDSDVASEWAFLVDVGPCTAPDHHASLNEMFPDAVEAVLGCSGAQVHNCEIKRGWTPTSLADCSRCYVQWSSRLQQHDAALDSSHAGECSPSMASLGVLKPRPTSLYHRTPPLPGTFFTTFFPNLHDHEATACSSVLVQ